eukprot:GHVS01107704.1.p1 GENE.GHVS01107704.1~~GHVS01107704.1.p1  ORF type:complete len:1208 (+),score=328.37 GHVS01107704.1:542-3625(+)
MMPSGQIACPPQTPPRQPSHHPVSSSPGYPIGGSIRTTTLAEQQEQQKVVGKADGEEQYYEEIKVRVFKHQPQQRQQSQQEQNTKDNIATQKSNSRLASQQITSALPQQQQQYEVVRGVPTADRRGYLCELPYPPYKPIAAVNERAERDNNYSGGVDRTAGNGLLDNNNNMGFVKGEHHQQESDNTKFDVEEARLWEDDSRRWEKAEREWLQEEARLRRRRKAETVTDGGDGSGGGGVEEEDGVVVDRSISARRERRSEEIDNEELFHMFFKKQHESDNNNRNKNITTTTSRIEEKHNYDNVDNNNDRNRMLKEQHNINNYCQASAAPATTSRGDHGGVVVIKKALCVGINYGNKHCQISAGVSDCLLWANLFASELQFDHIKVLADEDEDGILVSAPSKLPSKYNILCGLRWLVDDSSPGDVLAFIFCGCSSQIPDFYKSGEVEESLVPLDFQLTDLRGLPNLIYSDEIHENLANLSDGSQLLCVFDCSHASSTLLPLHLSLDSSDFITTERTTTTANKLAIRENIRKPPDMSACRPPQPWSDWGEHDVSVRSAELTSIHRKSKFRTFADDPLGVCAGSSTLGCAMFCIAASRWDQTAIETNIDGRITGVLTFCLLEALYLLRYSCTYMDWLITANQTLQHLINRGSRFPYCDQRPQLAFVKAFPPDAVSVFSHTPVDLASAATLSPPSVVLSPSGDSFFPPQADLLPPRGRIDIHIHSICDIKRTTPELKISNCSPNLGDNYSALPHIPRYPSNSKMTQPPPPPRASTSTATRYAQTIPQQQRRSSLQANDNTDDRNIRDDGAMDCHLPYGSSGYFVSAELGMAAKLQNRTEQMMLLSGVRTLTRRGSRNLRDARMEEVEFQETLSLEWNSPDTQRELLICVWEDDPWGMETLLGETIILLSDNRCRLFSEWCMRNRVGKMLGRAKLQVSCHQPQRTQKTMLLFEEEEQEEEERVDYIRGGGGKCRRQVKEDETGNCRNHGSSRSRSGFTANKNNHNNGLGSSPTNNNNNCWYLSDRTTTRRSGG